MIDKTKPWLSASHPDAKSCKIEGKKLYADLQAKGVDLTGVGVGVTDDNQSAAIRISVKTNKDAKLVPSTYNGYTVKVIVTGVISAY